MLTHIRRIQKVTLIIVTVIIVIAFAFLYSNYDTSGAGPGQFCLVKAYNRCYRQKEAQKLATHFDVALKLGMYDFAVPLIRSEKGESDPLDFVLNLIVLRKEAAKLGIEPSVDEIKKAIPKLPVFQQPWVDAAYVQNGILGPNGFSDGDMALLVKDYLSYKKLRELIGSGVQAVPSEVEREYINRNQRIDAFAIKFDRKDYVKKVKVTEAEIKAYYDQNNKADDKEKETESENNLFSEEKRGFDYVTFTPDTAPKDATNEQISKRNLDFANKVNRIYADLSEDDADFPAITKKFQADKKATAGMKVKAGKFPAFAADKAPEPIKEDEAQIASLFSGTVEKGAVTVPFQQADGSYTIYKFSEQIKPQPLALKQATPAITTVLKNKKSNKQVSDAANAALAKLNDLLKAGKTIQAAAKEAGLKLTKVPNFSQAEPPANTPDANLITTGAAGLGEKSLSKVISQPNGLGYFLVYVDKLQIYKDDKKDAAIRSITATKDAEAKGALFTAWLNKRREESGAVKNVKEVPKRNS